jgi:hypothetical protein
MTETNRRKLLKPSDPEMVNAAGKLRQMLLKFRFNSYGSMHQSPIPGAENLRPRSRDLLCSLLAPVRRYQPMVKILSHFVKRYHDPVTRESLGPRQDTLLAVVFELVHSAPDMPVRIKLLAEATNALLQRSGKRLVLTDKATGTLLSSLGFRSKNRTNQGWHLLLGSDTNKRVHQLRQTHGIAHLETPILESCTKTCATCQTDSGSVGSA